MSVNVKVPDKNMNSVPLGGSCYQMPPGSPRAAREMMAKTRDAGYRSMGPAYNTMSYRDTRPKSPPQPDVFKPTTLLDSPPHSPEPGLGYDDDRIQNDLLAEICSDIGIKDAMDLDFFDFDGADQYGLPHMKDDGCPDQTIPFGQMQPQERFLEQQEQMAAMANMVRKQNSEVSSNNNVKGQTGIKTKDSLDVPTVNDCIASPTVSSSLQCCQQQGNQVSSTPGSINSSLGSPLVHSTSNLSQRPGLMEANMASPASTGMPGSQVSQGPMSVESAIGSPAPPCGPAVPKTISRHLSKDGSMASPAPSDGSQESMNDANDVFLKPIGTPRHIKQEPVSSSLPASPAKGSVAEMMAKAQSMNDLHHFKDISSTKQFLSCTQKAKVVPAPDPMQQDNAVHSQQEMREMKPPKSEVFHFRGQMHPNYSPVRHKLHSGRHVTMNGEKIWEMKADDHVAARSRALESPFDSGCYSVTESAYTCSQYASSSNLSGNCLPRNPAADSREKVLRYLGQNVPAGSGTAEPSAQGFPDTASTMTNHSVPSQPESPQHVAKKARVISSGNDLLEEMRERYSFTKGADMYAKPRYPQMPGQRASPQMLDYDKSEQRQFRPSLVPNGNPALSCQRSVMTQGNVDTNTMPFRQQTFQDPTQMYPPKQLPLQRPDQQMNQQYPQHCLQKRNLPPGNGAINSQGYMQIQNQANFDFNQNSASGQQPMAANPYNRNFPQNQNMYNQTDSLAAPADSAMAQHMTRPNYGLQNRPGNLAKCSMPMQRAPLSQPRMPQEGAAGPYRAMPDSSQYGYMSGTPQMSPAPNYPNPGTFSGAVEPDGSMGNNLAMGCSVASKNIQGMDQSNMYNAQAINKDGMLNSCSNTPEARYPPQAVGQPYPQSQGGFSAMPGQPNYPPQQPIDSDYNQDQQMRNQYANQPAQYSVNPSSAHLARGGDNMGGFQDNMQCMQSAGQMPGASLGTEWAGSQSMGNVASPAGIPGINSGQPMTSHHGLMQHIIRDQSSAFRSHLLFPLLRDLIIADMNFHSPTFPFQLIANLPVDFNKLLHNYMNRNPVPSNYQGNQAVQGVIMDALKYAHRALIEKIQAKKEQLGLKEAPRPLSAIEDFCERFDRAVKNSLTPDPSQPGGQMLPGVSSSNQVLPTSTTSSRFRSAVSRSSSLPPTPKKSHCRMFGEENADTHSDSSVSSARSNTETASTTTAGTGKNKVLPKEAVATMLDWLKEHQDNPYPNDDEKEMLIQKTKLTINQINYWFTNARRRILPKWALQRSMEQMDKTDHTRQHHPHFSGRSLMGINHR